MAYIVGSVGEHKFSLIEHGIHTSLSYLGQKNIIGTIPVPQISESPGCGHEDLQGDGTLGERQAGGNQPGHRPLIAKMDRADDGDPGNSQFIPLCIRLFLVNPPALTHTTSTPHDVELD